MNKKRTEAKGTLMKEAESIIDELLKWEEEIEKPNLSEIEEVVLELRERLSQKMAEKVIERQEAAKPVPGPACPEYGQEMKYKGRKNIHLSWYQSYHRSIVKQRLKLSLNDNLASLSHTNLTIKLWTGERKSLSLPPQDPFLGFWAYLMSILRTPSSRIYCRVYNFIVPSTTLLFLVTTQPLNSGL